MVSSEEFDRLRAELEGERKGREDDRRMRLYPDAVDVLGAGASEDTLARLQSRLMGTQAAAPVAPKPPTQDLSARTADELRDALASSTGSDRAKTLGDYLDQWEADGTTSDDLKRALKRLNPGFQASLRR